MKFTLSWLFEYLDTEASLAEICHKLNNIGLEVEAVEDKTVEDKAKSIAQFRVAQIISTAPHKESTKLQICQVNVGLGDNLQIICGAKNARSGLKVAFAPIGSTIPSSGMVIKKAKIAGEQSDGMLCSAFELGLGNDAGGIIEVDEKFAIGTKISEVFGLNGIDPTGSANARTHPLNRGLEVYEPLGSANARTHPLNRGLEVYEPLGSANARTHPLNRGLNETVIEINVTPNRGDCLGVLGIARELAAAGLGTLKLPEIKKITKNLQGGFLSPIQPIIKSNNCQYFSGFYIKNVKNQPSPKWLKDRLEAVGCNSISAIVDISNYVMLSLNQPTHCYDVDKYKVGRHQCVADILVRDAIAGENFKSLKEVDYKLSGGELVIVSDEKIIGLAGIIGGAQSAIDEATQNIFLEAAFFNPENIAKTGRSLNILSDARYRFERSIDLSNVKNALLAAANLILEICGGEISEIMEAKNGLIVKPEIEFDLGKIKQIIGIEIEKGFIVQTLQNLGFELQELSENLLKVKIPPHRNDIKIYQDLIEEIIRIYGLNHIKSEPLEFEDGTIFKSALEIISNKLANLGLVETINYSFVDEKLASLFSATLPELLLQNPIAAQMNYMRPSLLIGLLQNVAKNQARGFDDLSLFEVGRVFSGIQIDQQKNVAAALRVGKNKPANHYKDRRFFDVFDIKKDLFDCLRTLGFSPSAFQLGDELPNYYHPYRSKAVKLGKNIIGYFGEIHPTIANKFYVEGRINAFEIFIHELPINLDKKITKKAFNVSDFPPVNRDFAFVLEDKILAGDLLKVVANVDKNLITQVNIFDIYHDLKLGDGKKSIAFSIQIQPIEKTLTGEEIEIISGKVIKAVSEKLGGVLRG